MAKQIEKIIVAAANEKESLNLSSRLRTQGFQVRQSTGGFQTLSMLEEKNSGINCVIFLGERLEEMSSQEAIGHIRSQWPPSSLCIFHLDEDENLLFNSISMGANHALSGKNFNEVLNRLKSVKLV